MRSLFLIIIISQTLQSNINGQQFFYGLPVDKVKLDSGDVIIMNIPFHSNAKFIASKGLEELISFVKNNENVSFELYIYDFIIGGESSKRYSQILAERLTDKFNSFYVVNCIVLGKGDEFPIFLIEEHPNYRRINSRLEIHVK